MRMKCDERDCGGKREVVGRWRERNAQRERKMARERKKWLEREING